MTDAAVSGVPDSAAPRQTSGLGRVGLALGLVGAVGGALTLWLTIALGLFTLQALVYLVFIALGLLGGLVASRVPSNSIGWLMCAASLAGLLLLLPVDYGYAGVVVEHNTWPLGATMTWFGAWAWVPLLGLFLPLIAVRFPDGRLPRGWRPVDWLALAGTGLFALSIALAPGDTFRGFLPVSSGATQRLASVQNPLGAGPPESILDALRILALVVILAAYALAVASLSDRFRQARGDERLQLIWIAYAGFLIVLAAGYGALAWALLGEAFGDALLPLDFAMFALPVAIAVAILRFRLYDIDLIVRRTAVYVPLTALLAGLYAACLSTLQHLFVALTGNPSDAAVVLSTLVLATTFTPLRNALQHAVDRRFGSSADAVRRLRDFADRVSGSLATPNPDLVLRAFLPVAIDAVGATGGAAYIGTGAGERLVAETRHRVPGTGIDVPVESAGRTIGRLALDLRLHGHQPRERDVAILKLTAQHIAESLGQS
jgi:hypothetical protein